MSKATHTPGPWTIMRQGSPRGFAVQRGREGGFLVCGKSRTREEADAHLIAAAPDLLEALEAFVKVHEFLGHADRPHYQDAKRAIAKARGEA